MTTYYKVKDKKVFNQLINLLDENKARMKRLEDYRDKLGSSGIICYGPDSERPSGFMFKDPPDSKLWKKCPGIHNG